MATRGVELIGAKYAENTETTQYAATNVTAQITAFTVTNVTGTTATFSVSLPASTGGVASTRAISARAIAPGQTYTCPEVVGHILAPGSFISTLAGTASALVIRCSGVEVT